MLSLTLISIRQLKVTSFFAVFSIPVALITALFRHFVERSDARHQFLFRTAFYMPAIVASVAAAVLWTWLLNPKFGPINRMLHLSVAWA